MSIFDPYSLYKNRQRQSKKGQINQKKPINNYKAYGKKDLEEAYNILHAYGISTEPPQPLSTHRSSTFETYLVSDSDTWSHNQVGQALSITNKQIMNRFWAESGLGRWVATDLDLSKVQSYSCGISSGTIMYYYDISQGGDIGFTYSLPVTTEDRASTYSVTLNVPQEDLQPTITPSNRISKTISTYVDGAPRYFLQVQTYVEDSGTVQYWNQTQERNYTGAIYNQITNNTMDIEDFVNGNYESTVLASTYTTGVFTRDTDVCIASVIDIYFTITYTD